MPALLHGQLSWWIPASLAFCFCCQLLFSTRRQYNQAWPSCVSDPCRGWIDHKGFCCSGSLPGGNCRAHVILKHGTVRRTVHCLHLLAPRVCNGKILQVWEIVKTPKAAVVSNDIWEVSVSMWMALYSLPSCVTYLYNLYPSSLLFKQ